MTPKFIERLCNLDKEGQTDLCIGMILDAIDEMSQQGRYEEINRLLSRLSVPSFSTDLLLGFLTATLPVRSKLPARVAFRDRCSRVIRERGEDASALLQGL